LLFHNKGFVHTNNKIVSELLQKQFLFYGSIYFFFGVHETADG